MAKYALCINGFIRSTFESELPVESFPDIQQYLIVIPAEVGDNWTFTGTQYKSPINPEDQSQTIIDV